MLHYTHRQVQSEYAKPAICPGPRRPRQWAKPRRAFLANRCRENALQNLSDEQLLATHLAGEPLAFELLVARYRQRLYQLLVRFLGDATLAEDVFQETFLQVHLSAEKFHRDRRFRPWLYTIALNKARDALRSRARRSAIRLASPLDSTDESSDCLWEILAGQAEPPTEQLEKDEQRVMVRQVIAKMPAHLREILLLAYYQKLPYSEIAEVLSIPLGTVKSRLHAALGRFAKLWKQAEQRPDR